MGRKQEKKGEKGDSEKKDKKDKDKEKDKKKDKEKQKDSEQPEKKEKKEKKKKRKGLWGDGKRYSTKVGAGDGPAEVVGSDSSSGEGANSDEEAAKEDRKLAKIAKAG